MTVQGQALADSIGARAYVESSIFTKGSTRQAFNDAFVPLFRRTLGMHGVIRRHSADSTQNAFVRSDRIGLYKL